MASNLETIKSVNVEVVECRLAFKLQEIFRVIWGVPDFEATRHTALQYILIYIYCATVGSVYIKDYSY